MGLMRNIVVVPYDPAWAAEFVKESQAIYAVLGNFEIHIEHIGSTSVPGLAAKPIIDIMLIVPAFRELEERNAALQSLGFEPKGELGIPGRLFYSKGADHERTHHLHAFEPGHGAIGAHRRFRDFLKTHLDEAREYAELKLRLAANHRNDIEAYIAGKEPFIEGILARAIPLTS
jgi:GrpB-like predicted nucleotidyltransferase (UPF0157 family)